MPEYDAKLLLADGTEMPGRSFGADRSACGEFVFNTAMSGYIETLTDPSYRGQVLVTTYPLIGNYGVPAPRPAGTIDGPYESGEIQVQGLVVQHYISEYSHAAAERSLGEWLRSENIPAISGIDTRTLTRHLREVGTMTGWIGPPSMTLDNVGNIPKIDMRDEVFRLVTPQDTTEYPGGERRILLIDVGAKDNIARSLLARGVTVIRAPWHCDLAALAAGVDGIVIGNGPGNPRDLRRFTDNLGELLRSYRKPVFGICMGNQLLALAAGGETYKLPYGHRGCNQPVQDLLTRRCFITSQNHGYAVRDDALPDDWEPWFVNTNDGTNEGIRSRKHPFFSVQFHPESCPGPEDTAYLFDDFLSLVHSMANG